MWRTKERVQDSNVWRWVNKQGRESNSCMGMVNIDTERRYSREIYGYVMGARVLSRLTLAACFRETPFRTPANSPMGTVATIPGTFFGDEVLLVGFCSSLDSPADGLGFDATGGGLRATSGLDFAALGLSTISHSPLRPRPLSLVSLGDGLSSVSGLGPKILEMLLLE